MKITGWMFTLMYGLYLVLFGDVYRRSIEDKQDKEDSSPGIHRVGVSAF